MKSIAAGDGVSICAVSAQDTQKGRQAEYSAARRQQRGVLLSARFASLKIMAGILPTKRSVIRQSSFEKICRYFLGENWKRLYPVVELAIRHPKTNFYDDELALWTNQLQFIKTFNWNADPSAYIIGSVAKAILKKGVHFYTLSYHHKWNNAKRYVALRPATPGEQLPVWRSNGRGGFYSSIGVAIDQHKGGSDSTWSEGCQTTHFSQYPEFIQTIGKALGVSVPLGVVKKPDKLLMIGVGKFPYILIDQADFNYIIALDESEFDSADDLKYQAKHFVGVPKIETVRPVMTAVPNGADVLQAIAAEAQPNVLEDFNDLSDGEIGSAVDQVAKNDSPSPLPSSQPPSSPGASAAATPGEQPQSDFKAFIPQINTAKRWLKTLSGLTTLSAVTAFVAGLPPWLVISLLALLGIIIVGAIVIFAMYHKEIFAYVTKMNTLRATEGFRNPEVSSDLPK